jgi:hypothetical protein
MGHTISTIDIQHGHTVVTGKKKQEKTHTETSILQELQRQHTWFALISDPFAHLVRIKGLKVNGAK